MGIDTSNAVETVDAGELDEIYRSLSDATRRQLLAYLDARGEPVGFDELVEYLSATADDRDGRARAGSADPDDVAVALHHLHLPTLEDVGFVEVSEESTGRTVDSTRLFEQVATWPLFTRSDA